MLTALSGTQAAVAASTAPMGKGVTFCKQDTVIFRGALN